MTGPSATIAIIGGGSYQWTPELLADLLSTPSLAGCHLVLEDIDEVPLPTMAALGQRINESLGAKATITTTTDQRRALEGADFVIVTISTGGFATMAVDLDVPARYGICQSVGDTVGPGGISRAVRNIPVLLGIAADMEELCPRAWLLNITNPMTCLTRAVTKHSGLKVVGLCHEVGNFCLDLAIALGLPADAISPTVVGVNHLPIATDLAIEEKDGLSLLRSRLEEEGGLEAVAPGKGGEAPEPFSFSDFARRHYLKLSLLERWGVLPAAGDRHLAEFLPSILTEESGWGSAWGVGITTIETRRRHQGEYEGRVEAMLAGREPLQTWASGELPAPVIDALLTGNPRALPVNVENTGQCPDLPAGAVVECIGVVDDHGVAGRDEARAPTAVTELLRRHLAVQELTVEATVRGDLALLKEAFALDPLAGRGDLRRLDAMIDDLLDGTRRYLPPLR